MTHHANRKAPGACDSEGLDITTTNDADSVTSKRHGKAASMLAQLTRIADAVEQQNRVMSDLSSAVCAVACRIEDLGGLL